MFCPAAKRDLLRVYKSLLMQVTRDLDFELWCEAVLGWHNVRKDKIDNCSCKIYIYI